MTMTVLATGECRNTTLLASSMALVLTFLQVASPDCVAAQEHAPVIGYVVKLTGKWAYLEPMARRTELVKGATLREGGRLRPLERGSVITVGLLDGTTCTSSRVSDEPAAPPDLCPSPLTTIIKPPPAFLQRLGRALTMFFSSEEGYVPALSRAGEHGHLSDAVVMLKAGTLDISTVLANMPEGKHQFLLQRRTPALQPAGRHWNTLQTLWVSKPKVGGTAFVPAPGLAVGLYRLVEVASGSGDPTDVDAWILLTAPGPYPAATEEFRAAQTLARGWESKLDAGFSRGWLRAYLECLADSGPS